MRNKKQEFQEKLLSDTNRYDMLMKQKEDQKRKFESELAELNLNQQNAKDKLIQDHAL